MGHTLPVLLMVPLTAAYAVQRRGAPDRRRRDAMLLLALLLLLRCALDPWDAVYYPVPCLAALLVWETTSFDRSPYLAAAGVLAGWLVCQQAVAAFGGNQDWLAMAFALVAVPSIAAMGLRLLRRASPSSRRLARITPVKLRQG